MCPLLTAVQAWTLFPVNDRIIVNMFGNQITVMVKQLILKVLTEPKLHFSPPNCQPKV